MSMMLEEDENGYVKLQKFHLLHDPNEEINNNVGITIFKLSIPST